MIGRSEFHRQAEPARLIPPWTSGDVEWAARGCEWPAVPFRSTVVEGETAWLEALATATSDELEALRTALNDQADAAESDLDDKDDDAEHLAADD